MNRAQRRAEKSKNKAGAGWKGIVKVQRPIACSDGEGEALIYDQTRQIRVQVPVSVVEGLAPGEVKFYMTASINDKMQLELGEVTRWQTW